MNAVNAEVYEQHTAEIAPETIKLHTRNLDFFYAKHQALHAVTLGAAYTLHLDHLIGGIDVGKFADFAVLDRDPLTVEPRTIRYITVRATVSGGRVFDNA